MKAKNYILTIMAVFGLTAINAQSAAGAIKGKVANDAGQPEPYAEVWVNLSGNTRFATETDEDGRFTLKPLDPGNYNVYSTAFGYDTSIIADVRIESGEVRFLNDIVVDVEVEIVHWTVPLIDPDDPSANKMGREQLKKNPNLRSPTDLIANMSSDIKKGDDGQLHFRGAQAGTTVYFVDGVKIRGPLPKLPASSVNNLKVYTGGVPARYGDATGGVVHIETMSYFDLWRARNASNQ